jgi:hypothetical protein
MLCIAGNTVYLDAESNVRRVESHGVELGFIPPVVRQALEAVAEPVDD